MARTRLGFGIGLAKTWAYIDGASAAVIDSSARSLARDAVVGAELLRSVCRDVNNKIENTGLSNILGTSHLDTYSDYKRDSGVAAEFLSAAKITADSVAPIEFIATKTINCAARTEIYAAYNQHIISNAEIIKTVRKDYGPRTEVLTSLQNSYEIPIELSILFKRDSVVGLEELTSVLLTANSLTGLEFTGKRIVNNIVNLENKSNVIILISHSAIPMEWESSIESPFAGAPIQIEFWANFSANKGIGIEIVHGVTQDIIFNTELLFKNRSEQIFAIESTVDGGRTFASGMEFTSARNINKSSQLELLQRSKIDVGGATENQSTPLINSGTKMEIIHQFALDKRSSVEFTGKQILEFVAQDEFVQNVYNNSSSLFEELRTVRNDTRGLLDITKSIQRDATTIAETLSKLISESVVEYENLFDKQFDSKTSVEFNRVVTRDLIAKIDLLSLVTKDHFLQAEFLSKKRIDNPAIIEWDAGEQITAGAALRFEILKNVNRDMPALIQFLPTNIYDTAFKAEVITKQRRDSGVKLEALGTFVVTLSGNAPLEILRSVHQDSTIDPDLLLNISATGQGLVLESLSRQQFDDIVNMNILPHLILPARIVYSIRKRGRVVFNIMYRSSTGE
jgi:hypothetical protein